MTAESVDLLLITSRRQRRWIVPKGWPQGGLSLAETAAREAWEEAGVRGRLIGRPIGSYRITKHLDEGYDVAASVLAFPLLVEEEGLDWPEKAFRERRWHPFAEALDALADPPLARLLAGSLQDHGEKLRSMADIAGESPLLAGPS